jgi:hypothetical protein
MAPEISEQGSLEITETHKQRRKRLANERLRNYRKKQKVNTSTGVPIITKEVSQKKCGIVRHELGTMDQLCIHCGAKFWMEEKDRSSNR